MIVGQPRGSTCTAAGLLSCSNGPTVALAAHAIDLNCHIKCPSSCVCSVCRFALTGPHVSPAVLHFTAVNGVALCDLHDKTRSSGRSQAGSGGTLLRMLACIHTDVQASAPCNAHMLCLCVHCIAVLWQSQPRATRCNCCCCRCQGGCLCMCCIVPTIYVPTNLEPGDDAEH